MKLLAIDVGMGTQDILLYDSTKSIENCFKMVLPSQTQIVAQRISKETRLKHDIILTGETMGGGPSSAAVQKHLEANLAVFATERAALTLHDNIDKVKEMGVIIVGEDEAKESGASRIELCDVDKRALQKALKLFGVSIPENFAVAVQDHGYSPSASNRIFRFEYFQDIIKNGGSLSSFVYKNIPERFSRMKAVERTLPGALLMDTGIAAIRGAICDDAKPPYLVVNIGNSHTLAGIVNEGALLSIFEHHTDMMTVSKLDSYIERLCDGTLGFQEVFDDGGHGCFVRESAKPGSILVTGPRRSIMCGLRLDIRFAAPFGDMMLTGCFGLLDAFKKQNSLN